MKRKIKLLLLGVILVAALLSVTRLTFSYFSVEDLFTNAQPAQIQVSRKNQDTEEKRIKPGEMIPDEPYIQNNGNAPCYLRIKIQIPEQDGVPIFQIGKISSGNFREVLFSGTDIGVISLQDEYWQKEGEYIYYKNRSTGNRLLQNSSTPAFYTAIKVLPNLKKEALGISGDANQDILICAEAVNSDLFQSEQDAWESIQASS